MTQTERVDPRAGQWSDVGVRRIPQLLRYLLLAAGFFVLAVAGTLTGTVAQVHHLPGLSHLAAIVTGLALGIAISMTARAYMIGVRIPSLARQLTAMVQAMDAEQPVCSGTGRLAGPGENS
jgi:hypothetical protein